MTKNWFLFLFLTLASSLTVYAQTKKDSTEKIEIKPYKLEDVSLINLIANPEKYDGKKVQVIGYLHLEFEGNAIYLHEEDFKHSITFNSLWVNFSSKLTKELDLKKFNYQYVIISGTFIADAKGHMGLFSGTIDNITRLDLWDFKRD